MNIDLSTDAEPTPERTLRLAGALPEIVRTLNHTTMDHGALGSPADADRVLREIAAAAGRLPQLLAQVSRWVATEDAWGCIGVPSGEWAGRPHVAVTALQVRLDGARASFGQAHADLASATGVTSALVARDGTDD